MGQQVPCRHGRGVHQGAAARAGFGKAVQGSARRAARRERAEAHAHYQAAGGGRILPAVGQQARVDDYGRGAGHPARNPPDGAAGWRTLRDKRPERPVPPRYQPQQPSEAPARAGRAGHYRAQ